MQLGGSELISLFGKTRKAISATSLLVAAILLAMQYSNVTTIEPDGSIVTTSLIPSEFHNSIVVWVAGCLILNAFVILKPVFTTPDVKAPKCHFCGSPMVTKTLRCINCKSESNAGE